MLAPARQADVEVIRIDAGDLRVRRPADARQPLALRRRQDASSCATSHESPDELQLDLLSLLAAPDPDLGLVVAHGGGMKGKKVLDTMKKAGARVIECPAIKTDRDKTDFVMKEFAAARRKITSEGVRALVEAVGKDVRELAAACSQLDLRHRGHHRRRRRRHLPRGQGRGHRLPGRRRGDGRASPGRRCACSGTPSPPGSTPCRSSPSSPRSCASSSRSASAGRGSSAQLAKSLGMAPWQVDKARRAVGHWSADGARRRASQAVAAADFEVKGGGRDPVYAVERAILTIARARAAR